MTDLHTHILPQIDDGAKDVKMSLQLLAAQQRVGVSQIVCTPHFHFERQNLDDFVQKRYESAKKLAKTLSAYPNFRIGLKFGAEVRISPKVLECDQKQLCFQGTNEMLLEMPMNYRPQWDMNVLYQLTMAGVVPLIAHVERYPYVKEDPNVVLEWIEAGAYIQVNAPSIVQDPGGRARVFEMMEHGMVHVIASDTHSPDKRPPLLREAFQMVDGKFGSSHVKYYVKNANALYAGVEPDVEEPRKVKKKFWRM